MGELLGIVGPIAIITFIGWLMGKSSVGLHSRTLSNLVLLLATPALVFHTLVSMQIAINEIGVMALAALLTMTIAGAVGGIGLVLFGGSVRTYLPSLMLPNSGNLGLPLVVLAFGDAGLRLGVSFFFVVALVQYSVGLSIAAGRFDLKYIARQPLVYSIGLVLLVTAYELSVPQVIMTTTEILGGMMVPAMLILLGSSLATLGVTNVRAAIVAALARLCLGVIAATGVIFVFGFTGLPAGVVFLLATMPTAIVTFVFAERYHDDPSPVAGAIVVSTLLTFICLPALIWIALALSEGRLSIFG